MRLAIVREPIRPRVGRKLGSGRVDILKIEPSGELAETLECDVEIRNAWACKFPMNEIVAVDVIDGALAVLWSWGER